MDIDLTLSYQMQRVEKLSEIQKILESRNRILDSQIVVAEKKQGLVGLSRAFYLQAIDVIYKSSVGELERVLNTALSFVFFDKQYKIKIEIDERYGKSLNFVVVDVSETPPLEIDIKDGVGQGVRTVISFVVHVYYLVNKGKVPILFVDEGYSFISENYVENFFALLRGLIKEKNLIFVMASHDDRFRDYADRIYMISDGNCKVIK